MTDRVSFRGVRRTVHVPRVIDQCGRPQPGAIVHGQRVYAMTEHEMRNLGRIRICGYAVPPAAFVLFGLLLGAIVGRLLFGHIVRGG